MWHIWKKVCGLTTKWGVTTLAISWHVISMISYLVLYILHGSWILITLWYTSLSSFFFRM
jgi:hypothetical protein